LPSVGADVELLAPASAADRHDRKLAALRDAELLRVPALGRKTLGKMKQQLRALAVEQV
jgi:DNA-directed RNA polymerase alpha subunit